MMGADCVLGVEARAGGTGKEGRASEAGGGAAATRFGSVGGASCASSSAFKAKGVWNGEVMMGTCGAVCGTGMAPGERYLKISVSGT